MNGPTTSAQFNNPSGVAVDPFNGNIIVADYYNNVIRLINITSNIVSTLAGVQGTNGYLDGPTTSAQFDLPNSIIIDPSNGNIIVADTNNNMIRLINITANTVSTLAGNSLAGYINGAGDLAEFYSPNSIAINSLNGNIYISDTQNQVIRLICNFVEIYYIDSDSDGFGSTTTTLLCPNLYMTGFSTNSLDCNDHVSYIHPGQQEICNSIDDNCNDLTDEGVKTTYYEDVNGKLDLNVTIQACSPPPGYVMYASSLAGHSSQNQHQYSSNHLHSSNQHLSSNHHSSNSNYRHSSNHRHSSSHQQPASSKNFQLSSHLVHSAFSFLAKSSIHNQKSNHISSHAQKIASNNNKNNSNSNNNNKQNSSSSSLIGIAVGVSVAALLVLLLILLIIIIIIVIVIVSMQISRKRKREYQSQTPTLSASLGGDGEEELSDFSRANINIDSSKFVIRYDELIREDKLAKGSFGTVFKGKYQGSIVAIKQFTFSFNSQDQDSQKMFIKELENEISMLSQLRHRNILTFMGACIQPPVYAIVTEFIEGGSLFNLLHASDASISSLRKEMKWEHKLSLMYGVSQACLYLHNKGVIHRDLKSANVLLDGTIPTSMVAKVCDFGLAKTTGSQAGEMTQAVGTPLWMAPEVMTGGNYGKECDVFSFAIIMYEVLVEKKPYFDKKEAGTTAHFQVANNPDFRPTIPQEIIENHRDLPLQIHQSRMEYVEIMKRGWKHQPEERPKFQEIVERLESMLKAFGTSSKQSK